jgi:hypothetical protein
MSGGTMSWDHFGYDTNKPCVVCGKNGSNKIEPRFGYAICKEHYNLTPIEISKILNSRSDAKISY